MRTIRKRPPPAALTEWRQPRLANLRRAPKDQQPGMDCDYDALRREPAVVEALEDCLFAEQGGLCAYTGQQLSLAPADPARGQRRQVGFHLEHLKPQAHCAPGEDTDHANLAACWPAPNHDFAVPYGAEKKGSWPGPDEAHLFVSPQSPGCGERFIFKRHGEVAARPGDRAAEQTIKVLGLDHAELVERRRRAIQGFVHPNGGVLKLDEARRLSEKLKRQEQDLDVGRSVRLTPYCFAIKPALEREIRKLEGINAAKTRRPR